MRVLCWNLGAAHGRWHDDPRLHERAWHWIAAVDPDIAFLQETRPPDWALDRWDVQIGEYQFFASALVSRHGLQVHPVAPAASGAVERFGSYLATGELALAGNESLFVASVHTSARVASESGHPGFDRFSIARQTVGEPWWNDVAFAGYDEMVEGRRFLIAGDWNTARWVDADGMPNASGAEFFDRATARGWVDASLTPDGREGKTWYGSTSPRPYQPDHAFADPETALAVRSFEIEPWPITALGLSDHAPMVLDLDLEPATRPMEPSPARTGTEIPDAHHVP